MLKSFISCLISLRAGITESEPFFVVTSDEAAFANTSIFCRRSTEKDSYPLQRISCNMQAQNVSPAPVVSIVFTFENVPAVSCKEIFPSE